MDLAGCVPAAGVSTGLTTRARAVERVDPQCLCGRSFDDKVMSRPIAPRAGGSIRCFAVGGRTNQGQDVEYLQVSSAAMDRNIPVVFRSGGPHAVYLHDSFDAGEVVSNWVTSWRCDGYAGQQRGVAREGAKDRFIFLRR